MNRKRRETGETSVATIRYNHSVLQPRMVGGFQASLDLARCRIPGYLPHVPTPTVVGCESSMVPTGESIPSLASKGLGFEILGGVSLCECIDAWKMTGMGQPSCYSADF